MSNFERVLSDAEMHDLLALNNDVFCADSDGNFYTTDGSYSIDAVDLLGLGAKIEQAVLAKLAEQEPVAWRVWIKDLQTWSYSSKYHECGEPLYTYPIPCVSPTSDKTACVSENAESETQESAPFTPKTVSEMRSFIGMHFDSLQYANPETEEPDEMDRYALTIHDLLSSFDWAGHYDCDRIVENNKMVVPKGYALVPVEITAEMLRDAHIRSELGAYAVSNLSEGYSLIRDLYDVLVASAPKYTGEK